MHSQCVSGVILQEQRESRCTARSAGNGSRPRASTDRQTFYGTKNVVESHVKEVAACMDFIRTSTDVSLEEKRAFFRAVNKNYGASALCLSGGASFGYYQSVVFSVFLPEIDVQLWSDKSISRSGSFTSYRHGYFGRRSRRGIALHEDE